MTDPLPSAGAPPIGLVASLARVVTPVVAAWCREALASAQREDPATALGLLDARLRSALLDAGGPAGPAGPVVTDDDLVAAAETTWILADEGADPDLASALLERCFDAAASPYGRGAILLAWSRVAGRDRPQLCTRALAEFTLDGCPRGRATALANIGLASRQLTITRRLQLVDEGRALADDLDDPWTQAMCRAAAATITTYAGEPGSLDLWQRVAELPVGSADPLARRLSTVHHLNLCFAALGVGAHDAALDAARSAAATSASPDIAQRVQAMEALARWRMGDLAGAQALAAARTSDPGTRMRLAAVVTGVVVTAVSYERSRSIDSAHLPELVESAFALSEQLGCLAASVAALTRDARREPNPGREAVAVLERVRRAGLRFGWEDALVALARVDPDEARLWAPTMAALWPDNRRGAAARMLVTGLTHQDSSTDLLVRAAEAFAALPEPVTAGVALHEAALRTSSSRVANALRRKAIQFFEHAGADRSLAAVVRDRTLPRDHTHVGVPASQSGRTTAGLTPRQREVAQLAARGLTAREIASALAISEHTARNHLLHLRHKLGGVPKRRLAHALGLYGPGAGP